MIIQDNTPILPVNYMRIFVMIAENMGVSKDKILEGLDICEGYLVQPDTYLTYSQYRKMKQNAYRYIEDPSFYMEYGTSINLTEHGRLGHLAFSCATFEDALKNTVKYIKILNRMYSLDAHFKGDTVSLEMDTMLPDKDLYIFEMEPMMSALHKALKIIPNNTSVIESVNFKYDKPSHSELYQRYFGDYCNFGCSNNSITFKATEFKKYWNYGDSMIATIAQKNLEDALIDIESIDDLVANIKRVVRRCDGRFPKQDEVAEALNITSRTMARYLQKQNTTFQEVIDKLRKDMAFDYLGRSDCTIDEIGELLGYSSAANFARAFKKWTGKAPSEFRTISSLV